MLEQARAEGAARGPGPIAELRVEMFDSSPEAEQTLRSLIAELSPHTTTQDARVVTFLAPSRFICWNCCGLRFESPATEAMCPNCGDLGLLIPPDVTFALDRVALAE